MLITVTQHHIDKGFRRYCGYCPVSLAIKDAGIDNALVFGTYISVLDNNTHEMTVHNLSDSVKLRIAAFDRGEGMEPFDFNL